jgi:outer membrane protein OmpA-like peptidoglycan-associated protein
MKKTLNEEISRMRELAGIKSAPITLNEAENILITEGILANIAAGLGLTLATFTSALGQTNVDDLNYSQDKKDTLEMVMQNPEVQNKLKELGVEDNNIDKQIKRLKGRKITGYEIKTAHSEQELKRYMKMGYHLTSAESDTVITLIKKEAPQDSVQSVQLVMDEDAMFASGKFVLSPTDGQNIKSVLDSIQETGSVLVNVTIISSTDKQGISPRLQGVLTSQGYTPDNQGLSQARNNGVQSYLTSFGVDSSLINQDVLAEQGGPTIDQSARYVKVIFDVVKINTPTPTGDPDTLTTINNTYELMKAKVKGHKHHRWPSISLCRISNSKYHKKSSVNGCWKPKEYKNF